MLKVKYINSKRFSPGLTIGKVYDVIHLGYNIKNKQTILIENDLGEEVRYVIIGNISNKPLFEDVTSEFRASVINDILDYV